MNIFILKTRKQENKIGLGECKMFLILVAFFIKNLAIYRSSQIRFFFNSRTLAIRERLNTLSLLILKSSN